MRSPAASGRWPPARRTRSPPRASHRLLALQRKSVKPSCVGKQRHSCSSSSRSGSATLAFGQVPASLSSTAAQPAATQELHEHQGLMRMSSMSIRGSCACAWRCSRAGARGGGGGGGFGGDLGRDAL
jgi:hypothetical protein